MAFDRVRKHRLIAPLIVVALLAAAGSSGDPQWVTRGIQRIVTMSTDRPVGWPSASRPFVNSNSAAAIDDSVFAAIDMPNGDIEVREFVGTEWRRTIIVPMPGAVESSPQVERQGRTLFIVSERCAYRKSANEDQQCELKGVDIPKNYTDTLAHSEIRRVDLDAETVTTVELPVDGQFAPTVGGIVASSDVLAAQYLEERDNKTFFGLAVFTNPGWRIVERPVPPRDTFAVCASETGIVALSTPYRDSPEEPSPGFELWSLNNNYTHWQRQSFGIDFPQGAQVTMRCADNQAYVGVLAHGSRQDSGVPVSIFRLRESTTDTLLSIVGEVSMFGTAGSSVIVSINNGAIGNDENVAAQEYALLGGSTDSPQQNLDALNLDELRTYAANNPPIVATDDRKTVWTASGGLVAIHVEEQ